MNTNELQQLKVAWLAAKESGDMQTQISLLRDYPEAQGALIDFIAAYAATDIADLGTQQASLLPLTQRACQTGMERVFEHQLVAVNLHELRTYRGLSMVNAAKGLRLGVDVWKKFESGAIELASLSEHQLTRLAHFFQVSVEQFGTMLNHSQASFTLNRRQTGQAAQGEQGLKKQSFAEAIEKSTMTKAEKRIWLS